MIHSPAKDADRDHRPPPRRRPLLLLAAGTAQAADIRPGLWEFRSTRMSAAGMPTCRPRWPRCRSPAEEPAPETQAHAPVSRWHPGRAVGQRRRSATASPRTGPPGQHLHRQDRRRLHPGQRRPGGNRAAASTAASPRAPPISETPPAPSTFTTRIHALSAQGDMQADTDARWIAQCAPHRPPQPSEAR